MRLDPKCHPTFKLPACLHLEHARLAITARLHCILQFSYYPIFIKVTSMFRYQYKIIGFICLFFVSESAFKQEKQKPELALTTF